MGQQLMPLLLVAVHFSTSLTGILCVVFIVLWLCSGQVLHVMQPLRQLPSVAWAIGLFGLLTLSIAYASAPLDDSLDGLSKYRKLLLLPVLFPFLTLASTRRRCEYALIAALVFALLVSFVGKWGLIPKPWMKSVLKSHITHSLFMAFLAYYSLQAMREQVRYRLVWGAVLLLTVANLLLVADGRTGLLAFLILCCVFFLQVFHWRWAVLLGAVLLGAFSLFLIFAPQADYLLQGFYEVIAFFQNPQTVQQSSMGLRLHFWRSAWQMIVQAPWFGHGVGTFAYEYQALFPTAKAVTNPHNEFLLQAVQLGGIGFLVFLMFIGQLIRQTWQHAGREQRLLQGVLVIFSVSCLFNSSLFDYTEGHWLVLLIALFSSPLLQTSSKQAVADA